MQGKRLSLPERIKVAFTGSTKAFIPPLPPDSDLFGDASAPLATFVTKPEQLRANIGWVFAANDAIAGITASVPLKLRKKVKRNGQTEYEDIPEHEILDLLEQPSLAHDGATVRELHHTYLNLVGEGYFKMLKNGELFEPAKGQLPDALILLPAHLTDFKLGETRYSESTVRYNGEEMSIKNVIRDIVPNPANPYYGRSIVAAAAASIDADNQMQSWNRRTFQNNARPGLVFNLTGEKIDPTMYNRIKEQMQELYTGDGAFKSLVVENGEVKPYMLNAQDLDFLASREFTQKEILAMFKVPPAVLGMTTDFNRANMDAAIYMHLLLNVVPRLNKEVRMWNAQLVKPFDPALELYFENPIPEDSEAKLSEAKAGTNLWQTINETREQYGLEKLEGDLGDQIIVPINSIPLERVVNPAPAPDTSNQETPPAEGKKSFPKRRQSTRMKLASEKLSSTRAKLLAMKRRS